MVDKGMEASLRGFGTNIDDRLGALSVALDKSRGRNPQATLPTEGKSKPAVLGEIVPCKRTTINGRSLS